MENDLQNLLLSSNLANEFSFYGNSNRDDLIGAISEKSIVDQVLLPVTDFNEVGYFLSSENLSQQLLHNEVYTHKNEIETTYSLNALVNNELLSSDALNMSVGSPATSLSSDDISIGTFDEFLSVCPEDILPNKEESSPFAEQLYTSYGSPGQLPSPKSVASSYLTSDDESLDGNNLLQQFFDSLGSSAIDIQVSSPQPAELQEITTIDTKEFRLVQQQPLEQQNKSVVFNTVVVEDTKPPVVVEAQQKSQAGKIKKPRKPRTVEQKSRKQAQNRKAASRYRDKKKYELGDIFTGVNELEKQNSTLKEKVSGLTKEIEYLKTLMLDVIKARLTNAQSPQAQLSLETISQTLLACGDQD